MLSLNLLVSVVDISYYPVLFLFFARRFFFAASWILRLGSCVLGLASRISLPLFCFVLLSRSRILISYLLDMYAHVRNKTTRIIHGIAPPEYLTRNKRQETERDRNGCCSYAGRAGSPRHRGGYRGKQKVERKLLT